MTGVVIAAAVIALPALAFTLWPLLRRDGGAALLPVPPDAREQLAEQKRSVLRALREVDFEHDAGHVSDDDYAELRARYEAEAAGVLTELDRLAPAPPAPAVTPADTPRRSAWLHPAPLAVSGALLLVFGVAIGVGIVRYTAPDPTAGMPQPGSRPLADIPTSPRAPRAPGAPSAGVPPTGTGDPARPIPPEVLKGMLDAARQALFAGQYGTAIQAYQAVLKREANNVDAMTHLALIVAIGGHADTALETFDRALAIDPNYPPAHLYRGQVLMDAKNDAAGAIRSWEKFLQVAPPGEDRDRVTKLIADAKTKSGR
ncbi:MAG: tetratricopeptide repeat protein [Candidatus Rokubacteria bacterium]|nr:tetratricopeptide repeat protein [Candidatus Rokubacteria bacterium]